MHKPIIRAAPRWRHGTTLLALVGVSLSTHAATLEHWLAEVDAANPGIEAAYQRWQSARTIPARVGGLPDPMVAADFERMHTRLDDFAMIEYMAEQPLPWPGKRGADRRVAELEAEAVGFDYLETRRMTRSRVVEAHWRLWEQRRTLDAMRESLRLAEQTQAIAQARQEAGQAMQTDLLRATLARTRLGNEVVSVERAIDVTLADLNALLNAWPSTPRETAHDPMLPDFDLSLEQLQESATMYCCTLIGAIRRKEASEAMQRAARLEGRPMVSLRIEARQPRGDRSIEEIDTAVALTIPWLWRDKYRAIRTAAEAEWNEAEAALQAEINETLTTVQRLYTLAETYDRTRQLYETAIVPQSRALVESSLEAYQSGALSALELLDAQMLYQESLMTLFRETAAFAATHAELMAQAAPWSEEEIATGLPPDHP